ncbi:DNA polymerase I [Candidatus Nitronereus thalassa]|uniref:DNA polymerase I n=1 Tax=Candidatus Nitronereus thalassa TaxID=3020898 RepID=A0ABU3K9L0_9BACT|nr:DNA polymerase I [Candidatus Nitronereus thalassa]MDT7043135.1 DNA polymerase I [Candidatus Nitronereus thalassa]
MMMTPKNQTSTDKHLCLVDGSSFLFRAFHALPILTRPDGTPVNAVLGFSNMLLKLLDDLHATHLAVIFDSARKTFRNDISADYKANRPEPPDELIPQFPLVRDATRAFNVECIESPGFEADDLIATYAKQAEAEGIEVIIVSSDKDLMQLVTGRVSMFDAIKNKKIGPKEVLEKFGVGPEKVVDVQSLAGDSTDNVPGVPGIGIKTAAQLIQEYGDLDSLLARASEIKQPKRRQSLIDYADQARMSRDLVRLRNDVPTDLAVSQLQRQNPDPQQLLTFLNEQGFKSLMAKVHSRLLASGENIPDIGGRPVTDPATTPPSTTQYELVQSTAVLQDWVTQARFAGAIAVDTETTSLDESRAELVGISLCVKPGHACYIPLAHRHPEPTAELDFSEASAKKTSSPQAEPLIQIPIDEALDILKPLLAEPSVLKIGHNLKYDIVVLRRYGITIKPIDDTMLMSYILDGGSHGHGMDELAQLHLGHTTIKFKEVAGAGKSQITFDLVPLDTALAYAAEDADITLQLHQMLKPRLLAEQLVTPYETLERPLIPVLVDMECEGIKVDRENLELLSQDFANRQATLEQDIFQLTGHEFNVGSPKQLGEVLYEEMKLEGGQKGKSGAYSTGADVLEGLAAEGHELPAKVLAWRQLDKLKSTYSDALVEQINPRTGRVHTSYAMAAASTGRLSSTDPNLQNIPIRTEDGRKIRHAFVAKPGCTLLSLDYSQIELRLLAHIANIDVLKQAFHEGQDIHALTASQIFGVDAKALDPAMRRKAKAINFGIIYGISAFGLSRQLGITNEESAAYMKAYFERYPGIQEYMDRTKQFCREHGYVETLFGRRVHVPGIHERNAARRNFSERAAINAPIQGTAADILKRAMIRVPPGLAKHNLATKAKMLLTVHDELLFEVEEHAMNQTSDVVKKIMESASLPAVHISVPLTVDVGHGASWGEAH